MYTESNIHAITAVCIIVVVVAILSSNIFYDMLDSITSHCSQDWNGRKVSANRARQCRNVRKNDMMQEMQRNDTNNTEPKVK